MRKVGLEFEFPAVFLDGRSIDRATVKRLWYAFSKKHPEWNTIIQKIRVVPIGVDRTIHGYTESITNDAGVGLIEFSPKPEMSLHDAAKKFYKTFSYFIAVAKKQHIALLAMGMHPVTEFGWQYETEKDWYIFLHRKMKQRRWCTMIASHQTAVDIAVAEWVPVINMLSAFSGLMIALTASSPLLLTRPTNISQNSSVFSQRCIKERSDNCRPFLQ